MTAYEHLRRRADSNEAEPLLVGEDGSWTAAELLGVTDEWAERLSAAGVRPRDRVVLCLPNSPTFLAVWFAIVRENAVMVPVNPEAPPAEVGWIADHADARVIVDSNGLGPPREPTRGVSVPDEIATVLYTSGSTGKPKGCMLSHDYYEIAGRTWAHTFELTDEDRLLLMLPLFHMNPQITTVFGAFHSGATIVWVERFSLSRFWHQVDVLRPTQAFLIGAIPVLLVRHHDGDRKSSLRKVACSGLQDDIRAACERRFGFHMAEGYGLTEGGVVTMERLGEPHVPGSAGRAVPGRSIAIHRPDGHPCRAGDDGVIWVGGDGLMSGYLGDAEATAWALPEKGWLRTSDLGHVDTENRLYFAGRSGDIVRRSGENISLREVESTLRSHPAVSEVAVITIPDAIHGVELAAYVVLSRERSIGADALAEHCAKILTRHKIPRFFHLCPELPTTGMARVSKARLREGAVRPYASYERATGPSPR